MIYSGLATTAKRLLTQYGQTVTLNYYSAKVFDPILGNYTGGVTLSLAGKGAIFKYNRSEVDGEQIIEGDANLYLSITATPKAGDKVSIDSVDWHIVGITELNPAGTSVYYQAQIRK